MCASCQWLFRVVRSASFGGCPKCGFASYGVRFVYGNAAYHYAVTQKPWFDQKMAGYAQGLLKEINRPRRQRPFYRLSESQDGSK